MATPQPLPGWYPNPDGSDDERYWDGHGWTKDRRPTSVSAPSVASADISDPPRIPAQAAALVPPSGPLRAAGAEALPPQHSAPPPEPLTPAVAQTINAMLIWPVLAIRSEPDAAHRVRDSAQSEAIQVDADFASELIASGLTTQPVETVMAVLAASRDGASINAAAKAAGINYRTAKRIVEAAGERQQCRFAAVS
jgi:hypothetical protein